MEVNTNKFNMVDGLQKPNGKDKEGMKKISFCQGPVVQSMVYGTFIPVMIPKFNSKKMLVLPLSFQVWYISEIIAIPCN